jgi:hypothetical protein
VPVPSQALLDDAPRRAVYHTNRAAAYLERVWQLQAAGAAAAAAAAAAANAARSGIVGGGSGGNSTKKLITELEPETAATTSAIDNSSSSHNTYTGSSSSSSWVEVGGSLDGMALDSSPGSLAKQLEAAVLDCRAALALVPRHAKAQYR